MLQKQIINMSLEIDIEEYLQYFTVEESVTNNEKFLKVRLHPTCALLNNVTLGKVSELLTDQFFDDSNFSLAKHKTFVRRRGSKVVKQQSHTLHFGCQVYQESIWVDGEVTQELSSILQYEFKRRPVTLKSGHSLDMYLDKISNPIEYEVISIRKPLETLDKQSIFDAFYEVINELNCVLDGVTPFAFSKFMYHLQCSKKYELFDDIFSSLEPVHELIAINVEKLLAHKDGDSNAILRQMRQKYLWTMSSQLDRIQIMFERNLFEENECYEKLRGLRELVMNDKALLVSCDPYD